jgi:hypothetical protein
MSLKDLIAGILVYAISSLLLILLLGPIGVGIVAIMGFLMLVGLLSSRLRK